MASKSKNSFKFDKSVREKLIELGGTCAKSSLTFEKLMLSVELPPLHEFDIISENISHGDFVEMHGTYSPETGNSEKQLVLYLQNNTKTFHYYKNDVSRERIDLLGKDGWAPNMPESQIREQIDGEELIMFNFGIWEGAYPDGYYVCLTDPNPSNPYIYATDHSCSFNENEIYYQGTLDEFLGQFLSANEIGKPLIDRLLAVLKSEDPDFQLPGK